MLYKRVTEPVFSVGGKIMDVMAEPFQPGASGSDTQLVGSQVVFLDICTVAASNTNNGPYYY